MRKILAAGYAVLHFGKPLGKRTASVFGGNILGIMAPLMEIFAFWQLK